MPARDRRTAGRSPTPSVPSATSVVSKGRPPYEAGCSAKDTDYLHVVNWKKAAELVAAGKAKKVNGHDVLMMETAIKEGILSSFRAEVAARRRRDPGRQVHHRLRQARHRRLGSPVRKIQAPSGGQVRVQGPYGIPVIAMKDAAANASPARPRPACTRSMIRSQCVAYTSLYVDSQVAKWNYCEGKVLDKISVHLQHRPPDGDGR